MMEASLQDVHANKPPTYTLLKKNPSVAHCAFCQTPPRRLIPVVVTLRNRVGSEATNDRDGCGHDSRDTPLDHRDDTQGLLLGIWEGEEDG